MKIVKKHIDFKKCHTKKSESTMVGYKKYYNYSYRIIISIICQAKISEKTIAFPYHKAPLSK